MNFQDDGEEKKKGNPSETISMPQTNYWCNVSVYLRFEFNANR